MTGFGKDFDLTPQKITVYTYLCKFTVVLVKIAVITFIIVHENSIWTPNKLFSIRRLIASIKWLDVFIIQSSTLVVIWKFKILARDTR